MWIPPWNIAFHFPYTVHTKQIVSAGPGGCFLIF